MKKNTKNMNKETNVIADSSFYIYFLEETSEPDTLLKIIDRLKFLISEKIINEITIKNNKFSLIASNKMHIMTIPVDIKEIFAPIMTIKQIQSGEADVIFMSFHLLRLNKKPIVVLDDKQARSFLLKNVLSNFTSIDSNEIIYYTLAFLTKCTIEYRIIDQDDAIRILNKTKDSGFRASNKQIDTNINKIRNNNI